jgi:hypothetical protein
MTEAGAESRVTLAALQERAKELSCIYRVDEILASPGEPGALLAQVAAAIPAGWQYPQICRAHVSVNGDTYPPGGPSGARLCEPIRVHDATIGSICVSYLEPRPEADEGPFLKEERLLLRTLADHVGFYLMKQRGIGARHADAGAGWPLIVEFLTRMDPRLLERITQKMLTHMRWKGVQEAEALATGLDSITQATDENRPIDSDVLHDKAPSSAQIFRLAADALGHEEILNCVQSWMSQEKIAFLSSALEDQGSSLNDIIAALERFQSLGIDEHELPHSVRIGVRVGLLRRFFTDDVDFINIAKGLVDLDDFHRLTRNLVHPQHSHGKLGGKSAGLFLAQRIVQASPEGQGVLRNLRVPRTWYIASDALLAFLRHNDLESIYDQKYVEIGQVRHQYPHVIEVFKRATFPPELEQGLAAALEDLGHGPLIVRSSSLLEDRTGASFSGKYKSLFLANIGSKQERLEALGDAVAEVYASIFGPDPIEYRAERNLLDLHEEMGVMIQQVVGRRVGRYFLPAFAGVAFSSNEFRWSPRIQRSDGLVRMVLGLGTRAVDRVGDDFPVLLAPGQPGLRASTMPDEVLRYSPKLVDLIDLETRSFTTMPVRDLLRACGNELPLIRKLVSVLEHDRLRRPIGLRLDFDRDEAVVTFEGLVLETAFMREIAALLNVLRARLGTEVDIEFASDGEDLYLLQCRPQSQVTGMAAPVLPRDIAEQQILFTAHRFVSNARVNDVRYLVYVDPARYADMPDIGAMREVGRAVGRLNRLLPRREFVLMGPGRWGSRGDIRLGVSVTYSDINNTVALIEIARKKRNYVPDLSFGTHFFQDLVEAEIRYLPLFPDEAGNRFNEGFLLGAANQLAELLPEFAHLADTVRVIDIEAETGGALQIPMSGELNEAIAYFDKPPRQWAG